MKKYLEYKDDKSHKFWHIEEFKTSFTVTYGKVGTNGQSKTKEFDNEDDMLDARMKLINQKLKKGYKSSFTIIAEKWSDEIKVYIDYFVNSKIESFSKKFLLLNPKKNHLDTFLSVFLKSCNAFLLSSF